MSLKMPEPDAAVLARRDEIVAALQAIVPGEGVISDAAELRPFESDGLTAYRQPPMVVVLPETVEQVAAVLRWCHAHGVKVVPRGAGTSLSGGALPLADAVLLGLAKFNRVLDISYEDRIAVVQPGVTNLAITRAVEDAGFYYAPDPSSQIACTIGGNVAENSGGVHCLKYGLTTNNVLGVELVTIEGEVVRLGGRGLEPAGLDLLGVIVGSERDEPQGEPSIPSAGDDLTVAEAAQLVAFRPVVPGVLGEPDAVSVSQDGRLLTMSWGSGVDRVRLDQFNLEGKSKKTLRGTVNKLSRDGLRMEIVPIEGVPALLPRLKAISDAWMRDKKVREKRFSLGLFDERYLCRTPMAVVWQGDEPVAFANVFVTETKEEASVDLMRHLPEGPSGIMDFLFIELMVWAKAEGYRWFNLGMAPLSGLQNRRTAPLWSRFGAMVFGRGERFYNFRGLHRYKDKFDPEWEPRYIAVPGGIALPLALANVASLISGGLGGVVRR